MKKDSAVNETKLINRYIIYFIFILVLVIYFTNVITNKVGWTNF